MKMRHLHMALEIAGVAAVLYVLYVNFVKPSDGKAPATAPSGSLKGTFSGPSRKPARVTVVKEPDSIVEGDDDDCVEEDQGSDRS